MKDKYKIIHEISIFVGGAIQGAAIGAVCGLVYALATDNKDRDSIILVCVIPPALVSGIVTSLCYKRQD